MIVNSFPSPVCPAEENEETEKIKRFLSCGRFYTLMAALGNKKHVVKFIMFIMFIQTPLVQVLAALSAVDLS